ncbi:MAG: MerR family transcriptional regulator [Rubrobacter sp.]|nr:MerR family transcriptional regulator [Rubrobacter sp.]
MENSDRSGSADPNLSVGFAQGEEYLPVPPDAEHLDPLEHDDAAEGEISPVGEPEEAVGEPEEEPESREETPLKEYYTIGEVVARLRPDFPELSVSKVRYLERRRLINLTRTRGGYRLFSPRDLELLRYILTLQENEYLPLKVIKKRIEGGGAPTSQTGGAPDSGYPALLEDRTYTREELAEAIESDQRFVEELISVGVIGRNSHKGELGQRDLEIARMALEMSRYSIQPRHLRGIMAAVDREAAMFKQILNPELRSGDDQKVAEAMSKARHLSSVDSRLKELMMASIIESFSS